MNKSEDREKYAANLRRLCCNRNTARIVHGLALRGMTLAGAASNLQIFHDAAQRHLNLIAG